MLLGPAPLGVLQRHPTLSKDRQALPPNPQNIPLRIVTIVIAEASQLHSTEESSSRFLFLEQSLCCLLIDIGSIM